MTPLIRATTFTGKEQAIAEIAKILGGDINAARAQYDKEDRKEEIWINEKYQVSVVRAADPIFGPMMQINIRRRDGNVIFRDWRDFQEIKNQLAGPECEGLELYPTESRLVDTCNKYHIWVILDPEKRIPIGWHEARNVFDNDTKHPGHRQRPLPKNWEKTR